MKKISNIKITIIFFVLIIPISLFTQSKSENVKERLQELFVLASYEKNDQAASYIVYRGSDETRRWKDVYIYTNENEDKEVNRGCKDIKEMLANGGDYKFLKFKTETESEGEWCIWEVQFTQGEKKKVYFACLKINGKYCLGDID